MKENYYEYLEISKNASQEIIEKAYKTLVRKYHPDLQQGDMKIQYEEKLKKINEAYEILSNKEKKEEYDLNLQQEEKNTNMHQEAKKQENLTNINNQKSINEQYQEKQAYREKMEEAVKKAYYDAYIQDLKNRGYKIRYKKTIKDYIRLIVTILVVIIVFIILFQIPFIKNFFTDMYNENPILKYIVDLVINIFNSIKATFI